MIRFLNAVLVVLTVSLAVAPGADGRDIDEVYIHNGYERRYILHVPDGLDPREARPLLLVLHGGGGRAQRFADYAGFNEIAGREGFNVLYPQGFERNWNDGRGANVTEAHARRIDDVGFLTSLLEFVDGVHVTVDRSRVYVAGISNGGMMAMRLACEAPGEFAAIAAVAANMPARLRPRCRPSRPVSVLIMNGTHDPIVPFRGGEIRFGLRRLGRVVSTGETVDFWAGHNGCAGTPTVEAVPDRETRAATETEILRYADCVDSRVTFYRVERGGHTWPGGRQYLPERVIGKTSRDFQAQEEIWKFFAPLRRTRQ